MNICDEIEKLKDMRHLQPATASEIAFAEEALELSFADEYKEYVSNFGVISAYGVELTGVCSSKRLSVVEVTKTERRNRDIPKNLYVVEKLGIEGIILLQNSQGEIFELNKSGNIVKKFNSLCEYIKNNID